MIAVIGLVVAFVLMLIFTDRRTRQCRWREDRTRNRGGEAFHHCVACGAETFTTSGKKPLDCLREEPSKDAPDDRTR